MVDQSRDTAARRSSVLLLPLLVGAVVAVALGVFGRLHDPTESVPWQGPFSSVYSMKVWLSLGVLILAAGQFVTALWMYGKLGLRRPSWLGTLHRSAGVAAFVVSLPVGAACLWALGFESDNKRVLVHGLLGCAFYGAFAAKVIVVQSKRLPGWTLPVVGGILLATVVGAGLTSTIWYFATIGTPD
jgi:hypothetical protein